MMRIPPGCPLNHDRLPEFLRKAIVYLLFASAAFCQTARESVLLLCRVENRTVNGEYGEIHQALGELLSGIAGFPRIVLDTTIGIDSFPEEGDLFKARQLNVSYMIWGDVDTGDPGPGISLGILDMDQGKVSHIRTTIEWKDDRSFVAEMIRSKLLLWFQRTTMAQLIVATRPSGASVLIDGSPVGESPFEGMVHPGTYNLELTRKGYPGIRMPVSFVSGNTYQYDMALGTMGRKFGRRPVFVWLGISAALLGAGGIAHFQHVRAYSRYHDATPPDADFSKLYRKAAAWNAGRYGLIAAGGAGVCMTFVMAVF